MKKLIYIIFIYLIIVLPSFAEEYYTKTGGNDSLDGLSDANAWATISKATTTPTTGDTVYFRSQDTWSGVNPLFIPEEGVTYDGATYGTGTRATLLATSRFNQRGLVQITASNVTFIGFLVDSNELSLGGIYIGLADTPPAGNISGITVTNCEITNGITTDSPDPSYYYAISVSMSSASGALTASDLTITDNYVHNVGHEGITMYPQTSTASRVNNVLVRGNIIHNTGEVGGNRDRPLDIANDADNVTVEFNTVYDCPSGIAIGSYGPVCYSAPSPDNAIVRYNLLLDSGGISIADYFCSEGIDGSGAIYSNIVYGGGLALQSNNWNGGVWKIYNNTFVTNYSAGLGTYVFEGGLYKTSFNSSNVEIKNNIFQGTGLRLIRDAANAMSSISHDNNLFWRTDSQADVAQISVLSDASAIPSTSITISHDATWTYFSKSGGTDWTTVFTVGDNVKFSGFTNTIFNGRLFEVSAISADQIRVYNVYLDAAGPTETTAATGEKWVTDTLTAAELQATWETTAQITTPTFTGGTLPTGFSGTYGTDMIPNQTYFAISSGGALDNGATLGSPYNGCINGAGLSTPLIRSVYDIGAYEYGSEPATGATSGVGGGSSVSVIGTGSAVIN